MPLETAAGLPIQTSHQNPTGGVEDPGPGHPQHGAVEGVLAARVEPGSPAARNGLRPGDIVVAVNRTEVSTVHEFAEAVRASKSAIALSVLRDGMRLFIVIQ